MKTILRCGEREKDGPLTRGYLHIGPEKREPILKEPRILVRVILE